MSQPGLATCFGQDVSKEVGNYFGNGPSSISSMGKAGSGGTFLDSGLNDAATMRKKIAELQGEIKTLKLGGGAGAKPAGLDQQRDWLSSTSPGGFAMERPGTASS